MTIDEALEAVRQTDQCWIVFSSTTGEVLSVEGIRADGSQAEVIAHLQGMSKFGQPVLTRYFTSSTVTRQVLEQQRAETERVRTRVQVLTEWSAATVEELLQVLERGQYDYPMKRDIDSIIIVDHLWRVHRDILTPPVQERLRTLLTQKVLSDTAIRVLRAYLAALNADEALLKALWTNAEVGRCSLGDALRLMECFAYVRTHDQEIIRNIIAIFEADMPFGGKFDTMVSLG